MLQSESRKTNKKNFFLSVDLEDFTYDIYRSLNLDPVVNYSALDRSYEVINNFSKNYLDNKKITFFTTGSVAMTHPDLLKKIALDGHEIACHYHFHDLMFDQTIEEIEENILKAREAIKEASGTYPKGFRAPAFSINKGDIKTYMLLAKYFEYDSSYVLGAEDFDQENFQDNFPFNINGFTELPIITSRWLGRFNLKSGGTFFRVFTLNLIKRVLDQSILKNQAGMVYLHPYDFLYEYEFKVPFSVFRSKYPPLKAFLKFFRQYQWLGIKNKSTLKKLEKLSHEYNHLGTIGSSIGS